MIESIGYTSDGQVWIRMVLNVNGEQMTGTLMLKPELARAISQNLSDAATGAEKGIGNVGNSANLN